MSKNKLFSSNPSKTLLVILACILWGSAFPLLKITYKEMNIPVSDMSAKIFLAGIRFFMASILIFLFSTIVIKKSIKIKKNKFLPLLGLGIFQTSINYFLFYTGVGNSSGIKASIIGSLSVFFVIVLAHFLYSNDRINFSKVIGLILGFLGIISVNWTSSFQFTFSFNGEGFLVISSFITACCTLYSKHISKKINTILITGWQMFLGSLFLLFIGYTNTSINTLVFTPKVIILIIYSAFLSATAFSIWFTLLKYNKASEIALYKFTVPISGSILSSIFLPIEKFTFHITLGLALVAIGIIFVNSNIKSIYFFKKQHKLQNGYKK